MTSSQAHQKLARSNSEQKNRNIKVELHIVTQTRYFTTVFYKPVNNGHIMFRSCKIMPSINNEIQGERRKIKIDLKSKLRAALFCRDHKTLIYNRP